MSELELDEAPAQSTANPESSHRTTGSENFVAISETQNQILGVRVGLLLGLINNGRTPLVLYAGQPTSAAVTAQSTVDLQDVHIGRRVVLMFNESDPWQPIVLGCLQTDEDVQPMFGESARVEVNCDGERLVVSAKEQLVLSCGKASITLTKAGKILVSGTYLSSRSTGLVRIKGGSVQLN